ncbi:unnamed protein product [Lactuca virosa]|uniref:Transmembrane 9 superfamily member n=1 Tax=Lactuca virosa TaxID=75947 RepID=A0AAU9MT72_9ASTR|nr:unnamed protein product [Lactuca virosa]
MSPNENHLCYFIQLLERQLWKRKHVNVLQFKVNSSIYTTLITIYKAAKTFLPHDSVVEYLIPMMLRSPKIQFIALLLISLGSQVISDAFDHRYSNGDTIPIYANRVGLYSNPMEAYDYYDLPFCSTDAVKKKVNLNELLAGGHLVPTPYKVEFRVDKVLELLCNKRLNKSDVSQFRSVVQKDYYMHLYCDDLKIQGFVGRVESDHRDGMIKSKYFIYNHFCFDIFYNKDRVIEILIQVDPSYVVDITEDKEVEVDFTYSVKWIPTQQPFNERMQRYRCDVEVAEMADCNQEEAGWKNIHGDVFRFPRHKSLLAAALGSGSQLLVLMVVILIMGIMGVFQPYHQGVFLNSLALVYAVTSVVSGYTSVSFYHKLEGTNWMKNILWTGGLYFGPLFLTFAFNNIVVVVNGSTSVLPLGELIMLSLLWI